MTLHVTRKPVHDRAWQELNDALKKALGISAPQAQKIGEVLRSSVEQPDERDLRHRVMDIRKGDAVDKVLRVAVQRLDWEALTMMGLAVNNNPNAVLDILIDEMTRRGR